MPELLMAYKNVNQNSILPWYDNISRQHHRKSNSQNQVWPLICEENRLPPFQVIRTGAALEDPITSFVLHGLDGSVEDITADINAGGLSVQSFTDYDIIVYRGTAAMAGMSSGPGNYYAVMSDGTNTWYSEVFCIVSELSTGLAKISFWHDQPFILPEYHIHYAEPFYNFIYLGYHTAQINKPNYIHEEEAETRGGYKFILFQTTLKQFRFKLLFPEAIADMMVLIPHHHFVTIEHDGITYEADSIVVVPSDWLAQGHLIPLEFIINTNTVVQTTGKVKPESEGFAYDQSAYDDAYL